MSSSILYRDMTGVRMAYAPLSAQELERILRVDFERGFGPLGTKPNRQRYYTYLTACGSDVQVRTVAVKAPKRWKDPAAKEVVRASVDDPWMHILDLGFVGIAGYVVDWTPEGFGPARYLDYAGRWESEAWARRCMWKIDAPVINPELLRRTERFRWSDWASSGAHILDYLKTFAEHPEIEFLSKNGLGRLCTKVSLVRKLKKDGNFRQYFGRRAEEIRRGGWDVPTIFKAYRDGTSFVEAQQEICSRREFRYCRLPLGINAQKAKAYIAEQAVRPSEYTQYLQWCEELGMDLGDTKTAFPKRFEERRRVVHERAEALRLKRNAVKFAEMNAKLAVSAEEWSWLERLGGDFRLVIPRSEQEISAEGKALSNCLNERYAAKIARGVSLVVFVRRSECPDEAFCAVEYGLKDGKVLQCYGRNNSKPQKEVLDFVHRSFCGAQVHKTEAAA